MCGEMAGDAALTPLLLAMGLREFSMPPASILEVKRTIRNSDIAQLRQQLGDLLYQDNMDTIAAKLAELNHDHKKFIPH
jgi:phosphotransferase system enzyme I (PtsI)